MDKNQSQLLETIEEEILQSGESTYQRTISITDYTYETKKVLDNLVEKYGGYINRYADRVILFINFSSPRYHKKEHKSEGKSKTEYFKIVNQIVDRLDILEEKIDKVCDDQKKALEESSQNLSSYLNYFKPKKNRKEVIHLVEEIINHH